MTLCDDDNVHTMWIWGVVMYRLRLTSSGKIQYTIAQQLEDPIHPHKTERTHLGCGKVHRKDCWRFYSTRSNLPPTFRSLCSRLAVLRLRPLTTTALTCKVKWSVIRVLLIIYWQILQTKEICMYFFSLGKYTIIMYL